MEYPQGIRSGKAKAKRTEHNGNQFQDSDLHALTSPILHARARAGLFLTYKVSFRRKKFQLDF